MNIYSGLVILMHSDFHESYVQLHAYNYVHTYNAYSRKFPEFTVQIVVSQDVILK